MVQWFSLLSDTNHVRVFSFFQLSQSFSSGLGLNKEKKKDGYNLWFNTSNTSSLSIKEDIVLRLQNRGQWRAERRSYNMPFSKIMSLPHQIPQACLPAFLPVCRPSIRCGPVKFKTTATSLFTRPSRGAAGGGAVRGGRRQRGREGVRQGQGSEWGRVMAGRGRRRGRGRVCLRIKKEASGYLKFHLRRTINEKFLRAGGKGRRWGWGGTQPARSHTQQGVLAPSPFLPPPSVSSLPIISITTHPPLVHASLHHHLPFPSSLHAPFITTTPIAYLLPPSGSFPLPRPLERQKSTLENTNCSVITSERERERYYLQKSYNRYFTERPDPTRPLRSS